MAVVLGEVTVLEGTSHEKNAVCERLVGRGFSWSAQVSGSKLKIKNSNCDVIFVIITIHSQFSTAPLTPIVLKGIMVEILPRRSYYTAALSGNELTQCPVEDGYKKHKVILESDIQTFR